ncbi:MAG: putative toxin-antitoxin system toxin component, PIN family [Steroidobacteraceae bacterium]
MRIVADTNTVLSGLLWQGSGPPRQIINRARAGAITLHTSLVLLAELAEVIARSKFTRRILNANLSAAGLVADYQRLAVLVDPQPLPAPVSRDPDDDQVLACALAAGAYLIVSGDRDLLDLGTFRDIRILAAREALDLISTAAR